MRELSESCTSEPRSEMRKNVYWRLRINTNNFFNFFCTQKTMLFRLFYIRLTSIVLPLCLHIFIWLNLTIYIYIYSRKGSIDFYHLFFSFDLIFYLTFSSSILYLHSILVKLFYITFLLQFILHQPPKSLYLI